MGRGWNKRSTDRKGTESRMKEGGDVVAGRASASTELDLSSVAANPESEREKARGRGRWDGAIEDADGVEDR